MTKFRLLGGKHSVKVGDQIKRYKAGDVFESDEPLDEKFENKFQKIGVDADVTPPSSIRGVGNKEAIKNQEAEKKKELDSNVEIDENKEDEAASPDAEQVETPDEEKGAADTSSDDADDKPDIALLAIHRGRGNWDVVKVINGVETEQLVNDSFLKRKEAKAMEAAGYTEEG